ncbi:TPA: cell division protein FtsH, partial [Candidatus Nomurabacteria bacterium]|nr:cell division protein FtsH [Candidatus Nomurabacteria bacterium]
MNPKTNKKPTQPKIPNIMNQIVIAIFIFMAITVAYTFFTKKGDDVKKMAISDVAKSVVDGTIEKITVSGGDINIDFKDKTKGIAKKELESSLSETLYNYGVTPAQITSTPIEIKTESGFMYWILSILPFLLPVFLIMFLFWMLTRQAKGQGMQAFTFGQSKARITDPDDKNNKVTFKDVAGAKEAKEELKEIV